MDIPEDDAPLRARRNDHQDDMAVVGKSILIDRPRAELFAFWRDFSNLPQFMVALESVTPSGKDRTRWRIKAPLGQTVELETEITDLRENEAIGWRSVEGSDIRTEGHVTFTDAPGNRGTVLTASIGYTPPAGDLGRAIAKLFAAEPNVQARHELKRFKMLMETGEISTSANHNTPRGDA